MTRTGPQPLEQREYCPAFAKTPTPCPLTSEECAERHIHHAMPRYRATFVETTRYVVEFDSPHEIDTESGDALGLGDDNTTVDWFEIMDTAREDWPMKAETIDVTERDLESIEAIPDA